MEEQQKSERQRLVLVSPPFQGHISPMLQLGTVLHSKGFSVTILHTKANAPDPLNSPNFEFHAYGKDLPKYNEALEPVQFLTDLNTACQVELAVWIVEQKEKNGLDNQEICVIYDNIMYSAEAVASEMKVPSIIFRASSASYLLSNLVLHRLKEEGYLPLQDSILEDAVPGLDHLRFKDLPFFNQSVDSTLEFIAMMSNIKSSSAIIWNTIDCLEQSSLSILQQQYYDVPFFLLGPLHILGQHSSTSLLNEDNSCILWLNKQQPNSVIYTSLGSMATIDEKELVETAWGLANSEQPFLWAIRPGSVRGSEWVELLPEGFLEKVGERGKIVKWAPQKEVLAHFAIGAFWSHCGWNSTIESMYEGVPMICKPCFLDQWLNTRYVSHIWKVGLELDSVLERDNIARVVRKLMVENEGKEIRKRANDIKVKIQDYVRGGSLYSTLNDLKEFILSFDLKKEESFFATNESKK